MNRPRFALASAISICLIGGVWVFLLKAAALKFRHVRSSLGRAAELSSDEQLQQKVAELLQAYPLVWILGIFGFCQAIAFLLGVPVVEIRDRGSDSDNAN